MKRDDVFTRAGVTFHRHHHREGGAARYFWRSEDKRIFCWSRCVPAERGPTVKQYLVRVDDVLIQAQFKSLVAAMDAAIIQAAQQREIAA